MRLIDADAFMERLKYMKELNARCPLEKEQLDDKEVNNYEIGQKETFELAMEHLEIQPTAFDLESAIEQIKEESTCPYPFNRRFVYLDIIEKILKSAANATNRKNGGR